MSEAGERGRLLEAVVERVPTGRRVRVGVDGRGGAGKTVFGDELAAALSARGRAVVRASVDGFHRPRAERYRRGRHSPVGYWLDAYDYGRLAGALLDPFARGRCAPPCTTCAPTPPSTSRRRRWAPTTC